MTWYEVVLSVGASVTVVVDAENEEDAARLAQAQAEDRLAEAQKELESASSSVQVFDADDVIYTEVIA